MYIKQQDAPRRKVEAFLELAQYSRTLKNFERHIGKGVRRGYNISQSERVKKFFPVFKPGLVDHTSKDHCKLI